MAFSAAPDHPSMDGLDEALNSPKNRLPGQVKFFYWLVTHRGREAVIPGKEFAESDRNHIQVDDFAQHKILQKTLSNKALTRSGRLSFFFQVSYHL